MMYNFYIQQPHNLTKLQTVWKSFAYAETYTWSLAKLFIPTVCILQVFMWILEQSGCKFADSFITILLDFKLLF